MQVVWTDNAVKNEIAKLPVLCLYHEVGCQWRGLLKYYNVSIKAMGGSIGPAVRGELNGSTLKWGV